MTRSRFPNRKKKFVPKVSATATPAEKKAFAKKVLAMMKPKKETKP